MFDRRCIHVALFAAMSLGMACESASQSTASPSTAKPANPSAARNKSKSPMSHAIASTNDFIKALETYNKALYGGGGAQTLRFELEPGTYRGVNMSLADPMSQGQISIELVGKGNVILTGLSLELGGPQVSVENITFDLGPELPGYGLKVGGRERVTLRNVALISRQPGQETGGGSVAEAGTLVIEALGPKTEVTIENTWLIGEGGASAQVAFRPQGGGKFASIVCKQCSHLGPGADAWSSAAGTKPKLEGSVMRADADAAAIEWAAKQIRAGKRPSPSELP